MSFAHDDAAADTQRELFRFLGTLSLLDLYCFRLDRQVRDPKIGVEELPNMGGVRELRGLCLDCLSLPRSDGHTF